MSKRLPGEGGDHYKENKEIETYRLMENVAKNVLDKTENIETALWSAMAVKPLDRVYKKPNHLHLV